MSQEVHFQQQIHEFDGLPDVKTQLIVALGVNVAAIINIFCVTVQGQPLEIQHSWYTTWCVHSLVFDCHHSEVPSRCSLA